MKKIILMLAAVIASLSASAQMEIITNSFRDFASGNVSVGGSNGMGVTDMTAETIEWPVDQDGNEGTVSLLLVYFENMAPDDVRKVKVSTSANSYMVSQDYATINGRPTLKVFLLSGNNIDVTFTNAMGQSARLTGKRFIEKHVYGVGVRNKSLQNVAITSNPAGATVRFDGILQNGKTPVTIENVSMGNHTIALSPANSEIAIPVNEHTIEVTANKAAFHFDMYKTRDLVIQSSPADAYLELYLDGQLVKTGTGYIRVQNAQYGSVYLLKGSKGTEKIEQQIIVGTTTPETIIQKVVGMRSISITAKQNNQEVSGAIIMINGAWAGETPMNQTLEIGQKYTIQASYNGYTKSKNFKVGKNSESLMIRIPNKKRTGFNPFDVDYNRREWGISGNYIHRYYNKKVNGKSTKFNWLGEEGASNGFQVGITYQPYFGAGQGLSTGLYFQRTFGSTELLDAGSSHSEKMIDVDFYENALYFPLQYQFRLPLNTNVSIAVNAGAALTYGLGNKFTIGDSESTKETYDLGYGYNERYGTFSPEKLDYSLLFGASLQLYKALQLEAKYSIGIKDHSKEMPTIEGNTDKVSYKSSFLSIGLSLMF